MGVDANAVMVVTASVNGTRDSAFRRNYTSEELIFIQSAAVPLIIIVICNGLKF